MAKNNKSRPKAKYYLNQVVFDKINNVPRKISCVLKIHPLGGGRAFFEYAFQGTGITDFNEKDIRALSKREAGFREVELLVFHP
jgi:hypothetical protein